MCRPNEMFLRLRLGNDAMGTSEQVAQALRSVADRLEKTGYLEDEELESLIRGISDRNGNSVGEWGFR